jgi:hypothetical protein
MPEIYNTRGDESSYVIDSTVGQSLGEAQEFLRTTTQANRDFEASALLVMALL